MAAAAQSGNSVVTWEGSWTGAGSRMDSEGSRTGAGSRVDSAALLLLALRFGVEINEVPVLDLTKEEGME